MSRHSDKLKNMAEANSKVDKEWEKNRITPEKNEEQMKDKLKQLLTPQKKRPSFFR